MHGSTRGTGGYLINNYAAQKIINKFYEIKSNNDIINKPVDHWLNYIYRELNLIVYWAEPTISISGSANGTYKSSLR